MTTHSNPAEWLSELNSHSIYSATIINELEPMGIDVRSAPVTTVRRVAQQIKARGVGGNVYGKPDDKVVNGWEVAEWLANQILGDAPGGQFFGRGSAFRANLAALQEHYAKAGS